MSASTGFRITDKKGFHVTFENGWTVSVQFGPGNYCSNYDMQIGTDEERCGADGSYDAEVAIFAPDGAMQSFSESSSDTVLGRVGPARVLALMVETAAKVAS